jgi:hypothetical protein
VQRKFKRGKASKHARLNLRPDERMLGFGERKERKEGRKETLIGGGGVLRSSSPKQASAQESGAWQTLTLRRRPSLPFLELFSYTPPPPLESHSKL